MKTFSAFLVLALVVASSALKHVFMESGAQIQALRTDYLRRDVADVRKFHEVTIAVKQKNMDKIGQILSEVSDPSNPKYGKFLTRAEVGALTANRDGTTQIEQFLAANGVTVVHTTPYGEYITAMAPIGVWQSLLATTFYDFEHVTQKTVVQRAVDYSVPADISAHVEGIFNAAHLPSPTAPKVATFNRNAAASATANVTSSTTTPAKLNSFYHIFSNTGNSLASQSLFESIEQYYSPADLTAFQQRFGLPVEPVAADVGGFVSDEKCVEDGDNCAEANLDVQYIMGVAQGIPTTYWYDGSADSFLHWIKAVAATENPPLVHSMSYGMDEPVMPKKIATSFDTEAQKLGVQGVTIVISAGDDGAVSPNVRDSTKKCGYSPSFPATSPYVVAVGGTQGVESGTDEIMCSSSTGGIITSGGGFSVIYPTPTYQTSQVKTYFAGLTSSNTAVAGYTATGRGYPDVSMAALNYETVIGGVVSPVSGTSASAPVVAGMISLVNAARLKAGKSALGWVNPAIYKYGSQITNDITSGFNNCAAARGQPNCCAEGFYATKGWDPVSGFGSLDYKKFHDIFVGL